MFYLKYKEIMKIWQWIDIRIRYWYDEKKTNQNLLYNLKTAHH